MSQRVGSSNLPAEIGMQGEHSPEPSTGLYLYIHISIYLQESTWLICSAYQRPVKYSSHYEIFFSIKKVAS